MVSKKLILKIYLIKFFIYRKNIVKTDGIDEINAIQRHIVDIDDVYDDMKKYLILDEL